MGRLTLFLAAAAAALVGAHFARTHAAAGTPWNVDRSPFRITLQTGGHTLLQQALPGRLRYQLAAGGAQHALTNVTSSSGDTYQVATDEPGRTATVTITRRPHGVRVSVALTPATGVQQIYDSFQARPKEHFMGGGERGAPIDLRGQIVPIKVSYQCSYAPVAFFQSSAGYAVRLGGTTVAGLAFPGSTGGAGCQPDSTPACTFPALADRFEVCTKGARLEEDVYVGSPAATESAFLADVGRPILPPPSQFALMKWRDEVSGPADLFEDVRRLRAAGIPVGWVSLDNPWETCPGSFAWDRSRIPDPAGLIRDLHRQNVRFMLWVSPDDFCSSDAGYPPQGLIPTPVGRELDLTDPVVVAEFERRLRSVLSLGVDGVKGDRGDEGELEARALDLHNRYPLLYAQAVSDVLRSLRGNDFSTIFRAAGPGEQRLVPGFWNGDVPGDFVGLQRAILQGASAGIAGFSVWGSDIGGYASAQLTPEVFARWTQLGAVSPVFEVGGAGPNSTPWVMGDGAMTALRESAVLHYELFPYLYGLVRAGVPVLRPLAYGYPQDERSWQAEYELLVGDSLLAAPVVGPGTTPSVYLPPGRWVDLYSGATVDGGVAFTRQTPLDQLPLYLRAGSVVPFNLRTAKGSFWSVEQLTRPGHAGFLAANGATLALKGQPAHVQIFVPAPSRPARVTIGGRNVSFSWVAGPMPGVVVRVAGPAVKGRIALA